MMFWVVNVSDLMLDQAVVTAVERGEFHVYAVQKVEEALELFAARPARAL